MGKIAPSNYKPFTRAVAADEGAWCRVRFNAGRLPIPQTAAGADVTTATIEVTANLVEFHINGDSGGEAGIGTYTGNGGDDDQATFGDTNCATAGELIAVINGLAPGQSATNRRWRAGLADFRPQHVLGTGDGIVLAAGANAMLGTNVQGLAIQADSSALATADTLSVGLGVPETFAGGGSTSPDHFETGYTSSTAGVRTPVNSAALDRESQPGLANFQVYVTDIQCGPAHSTTKVVTAYDDAGNVLKAENLVDITAGGTITGTGQYTFENPWVVGPMGSPVWVELTGTGGYTNGTFSVSGFIRVA